MKLPIGYVGKDNVEVIGYANHDGYVVKTGLGNFKVLSCKEVMLNKVPKYATEGIVEFHTGVYGFPTRGMIINIDTRGDIIYGVMLEHSRCVSTISEYELERRAIETIGKNPYSNQKVNKLYKAGYRFGGNFSDVIDAQKNIVSYYIRTDTIVDAIMVEQAYDTNGRKLQGYVSVWVRHANPIDGKRVI